jgi:hypothetical protein
MIGISCQNPKEKSNIQVPLQKVTIKDVEHGIRNNIERRILESNGYFTLRTDSMELSLKLVRVHTEYLSVLGPNEFFACVDLATVDGDVYDVDFFLNGTADSMEVTRTDLHKLNGKPYYTWKQAKDKTWYTVPVKTASNELLGVIEGTDSFEFIYEVQIPYLKDSSKMWIPVAQTDDFQQVTLKSLWAPGKQRMLNKDEHGNSILYLELAPEHGNQKVTIRYDVIRLEKSAYEQMDADPNAYLNATKYLPTGGRFKVIADSVITAKTANTPLTKARALYDYIIDNVRYAKQGTYGTGDANYACDAKSGNCTEFHSFFLSLARSVDIPARFAVGAAVPSERNDGGVNGYHCWAEFYAEGKWWPVDISEANKYTPLATYYFGHHPANRIEFTKGRNLTPDPLPASGPINFMAYPILESDGIPIQVKTEFSFVRKNSAS